MKKLLFIVNPCSGTKRIVRYLPDIIHLFRQYGYESTVYMTAEQGDGSLIVAQRGGDFERIVCAGGDGTFNEVVSGMLRAGLQMPLGYIPCGSTNDFAASLNLPKTIMKAARCVMDCTPVPIDAGKFGERYFSYVASFGAFARTSYTTPQSVKNMLGHLAYILGGIKDIPNIRPLHLKVETEDSVFEDDYIFGAIGNTTSLGGVMKLNAEHVDLNDGLFELLLIKSPKDLSDLNECVIALTAQDYSSRMITFCSTPALKVSSAEPLDWTLDGEAATGITDVSVVNLKSAISLCYP